MARAVSTVTCISYCIHYGMCDRSPCRYTGNTIVANEFPYNVPNQLVYNQSGVQVIVHSCAPVSCPPSGTL